MTRILTWKDEGDAGPTRLYACLELLEHANRGVPYGTPLPGQDLGWQTLKQAKKLAKQYDAVFQEE
jgi:hypothetical protein